MWLLFSFLTVYVSKIVFIVFDLIGKLPQLFNRPRIKAFRVIAVAAGAVLFLTMWWGALVNRYAIDTVPVEFSDPTLPQSFDGYRIAQISDLHVGTFGEDTTFVSRLVDTINALHPDLIVFTGDIVNSRSSELAPHTAPLSRLRATDGVLSILGNHDYGDYANWQSPQAKAQNLANLKSMQKSM
ncbi:MAG: metallophosphoesterase [Duncaniella sp.]|nr:metallophosphoesterase [Duncaniella sp.]